MLSQDRRSWSGRPGVRRRQTLPSFPAASVDQDRTQQHQKRDSWKKQSRSHAFTPSSSSSAAAESNDTGPQGRRLQARLSGDGQTTTHIVHTSTSGSGFGDMRGPNRRLGRTPSSPSVLLSKVKERIREKVSKETRNCVYAVL